VAFSPLLFIKFEFEFEFEKVRYGVDWPQSSFSTQCDRCVKACSGISF